MAVSPFVHQAQLLAARQNLPMRGEGDAKQDVPFTRPVPSPGQGAASPAPAAAAAAAQTAATTANSPSAAELIAGYNAERAKILQGLAPQVQGIFSKAGEQQAGLAGGYSDALKGSMTTAGDQLHSQFGIGGLEGVDPSQIVDITKYLGTLPADSLVKQGAGYGAAAAFQPGAALQQGQYALSAQLAADAAAAAKAGASNTALHKINASASKLLGFVADAEGNPILGKGGKPIPVADASQTISAYQRAQLGLSAGRLDQGAQRLALSAKAAQANFNFKTAKARLDYEKAVEKGHDPDSALSAKYGYLVDSHGKAITNPKGRHIPVAKTASSSSASNKIDWTTTKNLNDGKVYLKDGTVAKGRTWNPAQAALSPYEIQGFRAKAGRIAQATFWGGKDKDGNVHPPLTYKQAISEMVDQEGIPLDIATKAVNKLWKRPGFGVDIEARASAGGDWTKLPNNAWIRTDEARPRKVKRTR